MRNRRLSLESLEKRLVLSGAGQPDADQLGADWRSVIVSFKDDVADPGAAASALMQSSGGQLGHVYQHALKGFSAQLPAAAVKGLSDNPTVDLVEPDLVMTAFGKVPTGVDRIEADKNTIANIDSSDERVIVNVAILDSGIDTDHPDLNVKGGTHFWSVVGGPPSRRGTFNDDNYEDDNGHGTHVAGIIGALDDGIGVVGVAPGANLWAVKVLDASGSGYLSGIIAGIDWVTGTRKDTDLDNDIDVVNMSLGGQGVSTTYHDAIKASVAAGVVYVVAAGNEYRDIHGTNKVFGDSDDTIPAAYPEVATISAMADSDGLPGGLGSVTSKGYADDTFADFSNFSNSDGTENQWFLDNNPVDSPGLGIDLMMPGVDIMSTYPGGGYATMSGTSMASPHAAGLVALHLVENNWTTRNGARDATGDGVWSAADVYQVRQNLIDSGMPWRSENGLGLIEGPNSDSPDNYEENLGWAGPVDTAPSVRFINPLDGAIVIDTETVTITVAATDGVTQVEFLVSGAIISPVTNSNGIWSVPWGTGELTDGTYSITATATDTASQTASDSVSVTVDNVDDAPFVDIIAPAENATMSGTVTIIANASDDRGVAKVEFFVGGSIIGTDSDGTDGWSVSWNTSDLAGDYLITATASDSGTNTFSDSIFVTVDNSVHNMSATLASRVTTIGKSKWQAFVTATVVDNGDPASPLEGVIVVGNWTGAYNREAVSGVTSSAGTVTFSTPAMTSGSLVTFTVISVALDGYKYESSYPSLSVSRYPTSSKAAELDALYQYLAETTQINKNKKNTDDQTEAVDLLMAYGM